MWFCQGKKGPFSCHIKEQKKIDILAKKCPRKEKGPFLCKEKISLGLSGCFHDPFTYMLKGVSSDKKNRSSLSFVIPRKGLESPHEGCDSFNAFPPSLKLYLTSSGGRKEEWENFDNISFVQLVRPISTDFSDSLLYLFFPEDKTVGVKTSPNNFFAKFCHVWSSGVVIVRVLFFKTFFLVLFPGRNDTWRIQMVVPR